MIDGYGSFEPIGHGGFSTVYRAHQELLDRVVAVKVLHADLRDPDAQRRFVRECRVTGRLTGHPNIITVFDAGTTHDHRPYLAMEYLPGGSLTDMLTASGPLAVPEVARVGAAVASALGAAHSAGILHRDIKPANILLRGTGAPVLSDFGIASIAAGWDAVTVSAAFTPGYAAPEVLLGEQPSVASDVFALGATLYTLLARRPPFGGRVPAQVLARIQRGAVEPLGRDGVPAGLQALLLRMLDADPSGRPTSADEVADGLAAFADEGSAALAEPATSRLPPPPPSLESPEPDVSRLPPPPDAPPGPPAAGTAGLSPPAARPGPASAGSGGGVGTSTGAPVPVPVSAPAPGTGTGAPAGPIPATPPGGTAPVSPGIPASTSPGVGSETRRSRGAGSLLWVPVVAVASATIVVLLLFLVLRPSPGSPGGTAQPGAGGGGATEAVDPAGGGPGATVLPTASPTAPQGTTSAAPGGGPPPAVPAPPPQLPPSQPVAPQPSAVPPALPQPGEPGGAPTSAAAAPPAGGSCARRAVKTTDYRGRAFADRYYCSTYVQHAVYANIGAGQAAEPLDDSGLMYEASSVWVICQIQGRVNPVIQGNTNTWWLYTQGDAARSNTHGYTNAWGYLPATAVSQGGQDQPIPGVPECASAL